MFGFLKKWAVKRAVSKQIREMSADNLNIFVDEYLKRTQKQHAESLRVSEKLNKAALLRFQDKQLRESIKSNLTEEDDEDDEGEDESEEQGFEQQITQSLIKSLLGSSQVAETAQKAGVDISKIPPETVEEFKRMMLGK